MKVHFWGVRGSIPSPMITNEYQDKIIEILKNSNNQNLDTEVKINQYVKSLPFYLKRIYGGNTTCIEITDNDGNIFILDAGTGIRVLAIDLLNRVIDTKVYNIFFTHFHWDHIQGFPFFIPAYQEEKIINFYSTKKNFQKILFQQQNIYNFPKRISQMPCEKNFINLTPGKTIKIGNMKIDCIFLNHPGGGTAYRFCENNKKVIFSGDVEFLEKDIENIHKFGDFFTNTDIAIFDSQYTLEEAFYRFDWGHTSYSMATNLASNWHVKKLILTHFDPTYRDKKISQIEEMAKAHVKEMGIEMEVMAAYEGLIIEI